MFSLKWISGFLIGSFPLVGVLFFSTAVGPQNKTIRLSIATGGTGGVFWVVGGRRSNITRRKRSGRPVPAENK